MLQLVKIDRASPLASVVTGSRRQDHSCHKSQNKVKQINVRCRYFVGKMHSLNSGLDVNSCFSVSLNCSTYICLSRCLILSKSKPEQDNVEVVQAENGILRRKLQSKTEGLMILSKEVDSLRNDLNQMKALNEHLMNPVR